MSAPAEPARRERHESKSEDQTELVKPGRGEDRGGDELDLRWSPTTGTTEVEPVETSSAPPPTFTRGSPGRQ
ncbi:hypothetical protein GCM10011519_25820 [Marmoricola endophyticus]|uniref:Uncharacterized protein n=1 Tax=Marmoricola endophyticus TaxID=2040280 RepID=A0A917BND9_9ACTN|nr:hypothetical protein GCM10011519_25820 [Marmoricola endophyticus]